MKRVMPLPHTPTVTACVFHCVAQHGRVRSPLYVDGILCLAVAEGFFGKDTRKFLYSHLAGALYLIPMAPVDHFQHIVYEKPDLTPAERHAAWKELLGIYMPWMKLDGEIPFYSEGEGWQRQKHIYESPFYYIDYCLAQTRQPAVLGHAAKGSRQRVGALHGIHPPGRSRVFTELLKTPDWTAPLRKAACAACAKRPSSGWTAMT